jgi:sortase A
MTCLLRVTGWSFLGLAALVGLYLVWSQFYTGFITGQAQDSLAGGFEADVTDVEAGSASGSPAGRSPTNRQPAEPQPRTPNRAGLDFSPARVETGDALAALQFHRPGTTDSPVQDEPLYIVEGVTPGALKQGPGHYPESAMPGADGNFAVAGHRTTYGAPFYDLQQLEPDDEVLVTTRAGKRLTYRVIERRIVAPGNTSVLGTNPLDTDAPTLTLTTCHPRYSAAQRMVVFATLESSEPA